MAFKMYGKSPMTKKLCGKSAFKKDIPEVTITAKKPVRRVEKVLSPGYSKNSSGDLLYKGNIIFESEASKIKDSDLYTKKRVGSSTAPKK